MEARHGTGEVWCEAAINIRSCVSVVIYRCGILPFSPSLHRIHDSFYINRFQGLCSVVIILHLMCVF